MWTPLLSSAMVRRSAYSAMIRAPSPGEVYMRANRPRCCPAPGFAATVARGIILAIKSAISGPINAGAWSVKLEFKAFTKIYKL
jgi:hypothetical protein